VRYDYDRLDIDRIWWINFSYIEIYIGLCLSCFDECVFAFMVITLYECMISSSFHSAENHIRKQYLSQNEAPFIHENLSSEAMNGV
jgi:hypothetical protein